jgi:hypothetical protein
VQQVFLCAAQDQFENANEIGREQQNECETQKKQAISNQSR